MRNALTFGLLLPAVIFFLASCSGARGLGKPPIPDEFTEKSGRDTIPRPLESEIVMPPPVDVSGYKPPFMRAEEELVAATAGGEEVPSQRAEIVAYGKQYLGTPYKYAGKTPATGFDCSGFTSYVYRHFGMELSAASRFQANDGERIRIEDSQPGDLIIFGRNGSISHVGMVVKNAPDGVSIIHSTSRGVVIDNIHKSGYWRARMMYAVRILEQD